MFDLNQAIAEWRQKMLAAGIEAPVPLEELEEHLREEIERRRRDGFDGQQAFAAAIQDLGHGGALKVEFEKINPPTPMKKCRPGLLLGAVAAPLIWLTQAVFPNNRSDDEALPLIAVMYAVFFLYFAAAGFLAARTSRHPGDGFRAGALTALVGIGLIMATFLLIDNVYLETVSKQADKIWGFQHSDYATMREYINWSFLKGVAFVVPVLTLLGGVLGGIGGLCAIKFSRPRKPLDV
jgi:hypothetical protein